MYKILTFCFVIVNINLFSQTLKFEVPSSITVKEDKTDKSISINFSLENAAKDCKVNVRAIKGSATEDDFHFDSTTVDLTKEKKYSGKIYLVIKVDDYFEYQEFFYLIFSYINEANEKKEEKYTIYILDLNDSGENSVVYTDDEKKINRYLSFDLFTGGSFDFFEALTIKHFGGELVLHANNLCNLFGSTCNRFGFYTGLLNFQNFSFDSSNRNSHTIRTRIDTGAYISGKTKYLENTFILHAKITSNQWGYYFNPTFRINSDLSDLFNLYASLHLELLRISTVTQFLIDTLIRNDTTNRPLLPQKVVFQSSRSFFLQNVTNVRTVTYVGGGLPLWINSKDKFKFYFDPSVGVTFYKLIKLTPILHGSLTTAYIPSLEYIVRPYYLFRFRLGEQFSGLNITIGGEIRGLFNSEDQTTINVYAGIRADLIKWFKKE